MTELKFGDRSSIERRDRGRLEAILTRLRCPQCGRREHLARHHASYGPIGLEIQWHCCICDCSFETDLGGKMIGEWADDDVFQYWY